MWRFVGSLICTALITFASEWLLNPLSRTTFPIIR
uniref:Uncharacterized protein n=1 Tax=Parascaris equorum TaxID=6256 RepID=A0A914S0L2_PAREQ